MLHVYLPAPFSDSAQQLQFEAVRAALAAEPNGPTSLLLGNLSLHAHAQLDAVVVRPHSITILVLEPRGGQLRITDFANGAWSLDNEPVRTKEQAVNPFQQFLNHKSHLTNYLQPLLETGAVNFNFITGMLLFGETVEFGPEVEPQMAAVPAASSFHLLANPARFTRLLAQVATPEIDLTEADLWQLLTDIAPAFEVPADIGLPTQHVAAADPESSGDFIRQKVSQLWRWLGAADLEEVDRSYSEDERSFAARSQEKAELEQLRASLQAELDEKLRAMEAREAERERSINQLREQLAQAPPVAPEAVVLQQQLSAEQQEKTAIEQAIQASKAESAVRNQALDSKIQRLESLLRRIQNAPAGSRYKSLSNKYLPLATKQLRAWWQVPRLRLAAGGLGLLVVVIWAIAARHDKPLKRFEQDGKWGFAAADGTPVIPARYASVSDFKGALAVVEKDHAFGFVDQKGNEVIPPRYDALNPYAEGYARARIGNLYTFIDEDGKEFNSYYYNALDFSEGHAAVLDRRGWFYISGNDETTAEPILFQEAYSFHEGLARVKLAGAYTFITEDYLDDPSEGTAPFGRYAHASDFADHRARVTQKGRTFFIDTHGKRID
ncbi:WG repeat-containing protein [Hymenobacter jejuensis]|uniref:WG repeat-containing protein n=1 Tax=Hymenobacter jejuensis TaxID=2502781 RepID=A0A5B7ZZY9_9BACT|nr:WG repeat-containing protein [Hymenobacter jejuensis]QDA60447.1 hypothetical protein FHG12_10140 [Hymenobacter jejuensis]